MSEELKPCPFCGGTPTGDAHTLTQGFKYGAIECGCSAIGPDVRTGYEDWPAWKDAAISAWNERAELAAIKAGQGEAVAWVIVVPGTTFKSVGFGVQLQDLPVGTELYTAPPASADAVSVPGEFPAADDHEKAIGWEYSYEFISQVERLVASRTEFTTSMESVQETLKAACKLRALLARQEVKS